MEKESVVRLRITREEKVLLHKGRVFRMVLPDVPVAAMEERRMRGMALPLRILILHQTV